MKLLMSQKSISKLVIDKLEATPANWKEGEKSLKGSPDKAGKI